MADRHPLPAWAKLATGVLVTGLIAAGAHRWHAQAILAKLGRPVVAVLVVHGVTDGRASWTTPGGWTWRRVHLAGSAAPETRAAVLADLRRTPGIAGADWQ
ncbi:hypothetical protein IP88_16755 [alpha proteobacterium AAP81b]|nr:hypothetical protein IP88_16755 [alpha proteobacterium AAP81b]